MTNVYTGWQFNATKAGNYKVVPSFATVGGLFATFYDRDTTTFAFTSAVRSSAPFGLDFSAASGNAVGPLLSAVSIRWQGFIQPIHDGLHTLSVVPSAAASQDKVKVSCFSCSCRLVRIHCSLFGSNLSADVDRKCCFIRRFIYRRHPYSDVLVSPCKYAL